MADDIKKKPEMAEIATTEKDIDIFSGWLTRLENPDPIVMAEGGGKGLKLYDEVDRDGHAGSVLETRYLAVAGCEWEVSPADDSERSVEIANFVDSALKNMNYTQAVFELMQALLYGFYVSEIMWAAKNGQWVPQKMISKHPRRFVFSPDRELRMLTPTNLMDGEVLPVRKFVCFTYGSSDNPYGKGLGQRTWWPVWFKKHGIKYWLIFLEKYGMPTGKGTYPSGTAKDDQDKLLEAIDAMQTETGITIPEGMQIELLEATRQGHVTYETLCDYTDKIISKAVLGQTASTEGTPGKLGNEDSQEEVRQDRKKADADLISEVLNATLVRWIVDFNFADASDYPTFWIRTDEETDLKALADRDEILVNKIGIKVKESYFYDTYGVDQPEDGDAFVGGKPSGPAGDPPPGPLLAKEGKKQTVGFAEGGGHGNFTDEQQALEDFADLMSDDGRKAFAGNEQKILSAITAAGSYEEAINFLLELYPELDQDRLAGVLEPVMLNAELFGMSTEKKVEGRR